MRKGYAVFLLDVQDEAAYQAYVEKAVPTALAAGAATLVYGDPVDTPEGEWPGNRIVITEFESLDTAKAWYQSPEYEPLITERQASAPSSVLFIEGFEPPQM